MTIAEKPTYNGWPNYETWCVHLHITNTQSRDAVSREMAELVKALIRSIRWKRESGRARKQTATCWRIG